MNFNCDGILKKIKISVVFFVEAVRDLESVFKSVDIDRQGRLDQASFVTALLSLNVKLPESEIDAIFEELDVDGNGLAYSRFLEFLKMGKIPSSLLNRVKGSDAPRKSIIIGGKQAKGHNKEGAEELLAISELKKLQEEKEQQSTVNLFYLFI
ncbi:calcium-dependent protein kinase [Reticulomyxa filosa]|uniref:Calcium-dependent protein kinase n=1 Tax=Reticulomyxa filosa TaxID=46433 RepID=X6NJJ0_RETFI|nr:calcium-dependent protein kinase [Reticulomyxa filosa]|eukprot:ETO25522.1 calcium-dependent protein kinase [Reticulomyxa filosa]